MENLHHLSDDPDLQRTMFIEFLINWVNQFQSYPHCSQALDLTDFQSGIVICELVYDIILQRKGGSYLSQIITSSLDKQKCIKNFQLALQQINDPNLNLTGQQIYQDENALLSLLEYLYKIDKNQLNNDKPLQNSQLTEAQNKKPPLPNKMKLSGTQQENRINAGNVNNMDQYIPPNFGAKNRRRGQSGGDDELLDPDNESDTAYMDNPYEMGGSHDNTYLQNTSYQNQASNRSSQSQNQPQYQQQSDRGYQQKPYDQSSDAGNSNRRNYQYSDKVIENNSSNDKNSPINVENIQKMSQSLSEYFKKQNSAKNSANDFFNIQENSYQGGYNSNQVGTPTVQKKNSQRNEDFDTSARNTSSQTKFYQMNKMRPGEKHYQAQIIEVQGEVTDQDHLKNYQQDEEKQPSYDYPRQLPQPKKQDYNNNSFGIIQQKQSQDQNIKNNIFEESLPRKFNSLPTKEPNSAKYQPHKMTFGPMNMKDMAQLSQQRQQQVKGQPYYEDVKKILNNKYDDGNNQQFQQQMFVETKGYSPQNKFVVDQQERSKLGAFKNKEIKTYKKPLQLPSNSKSQGASALGSQSFNCSPQQKNSFIIDKYTAHKQQSEQKIKKAQEFIQNETQENKVNLKKILSGSSSKRKDDPLQISSNGIFGEIDVEIVSDKKRTKLLSWLNEIKLLKFIPNLESKLHKICKDGVIFADIIHLMEGKSELIKGLERKPKKDAQITANYIKIFSYLKNFDKMNPRFLSQQHRIQLNENIFWGLLDDLWYFYHKKISPNDIRFTNNTGSLILPQNLNNNNTSQYSTLNTPNSHKISSIQQKVTNISSISNQNNKSNQVNQQNNSNNNNNTNSNNNNNANSNNNNNNSISNSSNNNNNNNNNNNQRRSNSHNPQNNLKKIQEEEQLEQSSQLQQQSILGDIAATHSTSQTRRRQFENYEDIIHDNHNETKRKRSTQRSFRESNSLNQNSIHRTEHNMNRTFTDENIKHLHTENDLKQNQQNQEKQQSPRPRVANQEQQQLQYNINVSEIKKWLKNIGFRHMLRKSEKLHEQYIMLKQQQESENGKLSNNRSYRDMQRRKSPNDRVWGKYAKEEEDLIIQDPIKNGTLICLTLSRIEMCRVDQMYRSPENIEQCYKNYDLAYRNIRARNLLIPIEMLWRQKDIFQGQLDFFWQVCHGLMASKNGAYINSFYEGQENRSPSPSDYPIHKNNNHINNNKNNNHNHNQQQNTNPSYLQHFSSHRVHTQNQNNAPQFGDNNASQNNYFTSTNNSSNPATLTNRQQQHPLNTQPQQTQHNVSNYGAQPFQNAALTVNMVLPYSEESLNKIKDCLIHWIDNMGIFARMNIECKDFNTLLNLCKDGAILCYILCVIFNIKIIGINRKSCTKATALSNIRKFLELFKRTKGLPNIFFITEEAIYDMKEHLIIYLLEELMRFSDNISPIQFNYIQDEPYIKNFPKKSNAALPPPPPIPIKRLNENTFNPQNGQSMSVTNQNNYTTKSQRGSSPAGERKILNYDQSNRDLLKNYNDKFMNLSSINSQQNINQNENNQVLRTSKSNASLIKSPKNQNSSSTILKTQQEQNNSLNQQSKISRIQIDEPYSIIPSSKRMDSFEANSPLNIQVLQSVNNQNLTQTQRIDQVIQKNKEKLNNDSNTIPSPNKTDGNPSVFYDFGSCESDQDSINIKNWLTLIGFEDLAFNLNFKEQIIHQFKDGISYIPYHQISNKNQKYYTNRTVLCKILEKLEGRPMKGINTNPRVTAHYKYNLKKCIELLEQKADMTQDLLWDEDQLYECSVEYIKQLLLAIRHTYRKMLKTLKKHQKSSVFSISQR